MDPTEPRWRRQPALRPQQIVDAALDEFSERGLEGARVEDIAARAGVSKATIYLYFPGKAELFREVVRRSLAGLREAVEGIGREATARASLESYIRGCWRELRSPEFEGVYRLVLAEVNTFPDLTREYADEIRGPITAGARPLLEWGVETGEFTAGESGVRSRMLLALLIKHAVWCARRELVAELRERTDEEVLDEVVEFYMAGVGAGG